MSVCPTRPTSWGDGLCEMRCTEGHLNWRISGRFCTHHPAGERTRRGRCHDPHRSRRYGIRVFWYPLRTVNGRRRGGGLPHRHAVGRVLERAGAGKTQRGGKGLGVKKGAWGGQRELPQLAGVDGDANRYGPLGVRGSGVMLSSHGLNDSTFSSSYQGGVGSTQLLFYPSWPIF